MSNSNDEALASALQEEYDDEGRRGGSRRDHGYNEEIARRIEQQQKDAEMARRVQQEMSDEELARRLAQAEERHAEAMEHNRAGRIPNTWTWKRVLSYFIPLVFLAVGAVALVFALGGEEVIPIPILPGDASVLSDDDFWEDEDPWEGITPNQVNKWNVHSGGLSLALVNSLRDNWEPYFFTAMQDWDEGTPDALDLTTIRSDYDFDCEPENGRLKVCNGNYGDTRWRGINQILISNNYIVASAARMNDYFLGKASDAQKQYTMCHEIGHGFGLPHSDEDFFNADIGNCMDYTSNPAGNQSPDETNYQFLSDLYGEVAFRKKRQLRTEHEDQQERQKKFQDKLEEWPQWLNSRMKNVSQSLEKQLIQEKNTEKDGWKRIHHHKHGEAHEMELGEGYSVQLHFLWNMPEDE